MVLKYCPRCANDLDIEAFGRVTARPDGLNLYCRECVRSAQNRRRSGALWSNRMPGQPVRVVAELTPAVLARLILEAIDQASGQACTQQELLRHVRARLPFRLIRFGEQVSDVLGQALGELFEDKLIATRGSEEQRIYFRRVASGLKNEGSLSTQ